MPRSRMPHVSVEARPEAAADRGSLKRERPDVDVVDLVEDSDKPSPKGSRRRRPMTNEEKMRAREQKIRRQKRREAREKEEKQMRQMREEREKEEKWMREEREKEKLKEFVNRWNICDYCYSVPFASDETMFCPKCKNDFRVWYDFCNRFSALERMMGMPGY